MRWGLLLVTSVLVLAGSRSFAYTAAGDRLFPATILLPQVAPTDDFYIAPSSIPLGSETIPGADDHFTNVSIYYDKTITERLSVGVEAGWNQLDEAGGGTPSGWQNLQTSVTYLAILDPDREFLLSLGANREWGATGAQSIGANPVGATTPQILLGKGMGDFDWPYLRPLAVNASFGYAFADNNMRPDVLQTGLTIEYSIPYLESKVEATPLPDFVRRLTPMVEIYYTTPMRNKGGAETAGMVAPGIAYAGEGWELGVEALVPATHAAGSGVGVIAQLHVSLDFFFPDSIGRPLFSRH